MKNKRIMRNSSEDGITLVALVVTIVVLLILAGITITYVMGDNSIFKKASDAKLQTDIAKARERLEVTFGHAKLLKHTDKKYNQDDYLNELMKKEIKNIKIADEIVIVDGYAFEIDRSEPKIGEYVGKKSELELSELTVTATLAEDSKTATIHIVAKEDKNGISKIEVIQGGYVLETYECGNTKDEVVKDYIAKQNGTYIIKVYAKLTVTEMATVEGIIVSIKYSPNGDETYKKEHSTTITVSEKVEEVKSIKYQWLQTTVEPAANTFIDTCSNGEMITKNEVTGTWYLWTLLETKDGKTNTGRSEGFNFDNQGPIITEFTATKYSETGITLSATAQDTGFGTVRFEFYIDDKLKDTQECTATTSSVTKSKDITGLTTGNHTCKVIVYDAEDHPSTKEGTGTTKLYAWEIFNYTSETRGKYNTLIRTFGSNGWQTGYAYGTVDQYKYVSGRESAVYLFKEFPDFVTSSNDKSIQSCNGTRYEKKTWGEAIEIFQQGDWEYLVWECDMWTIPYADVYKDLYKNSAGQACATQGRVLHTNIEEYEKSNGTGTYLTSTNSSQWPDDGYKSPYYTVKVAPR